MKLDFWFSADSWDAMFFCVRIVIDKQIEIFFHQMGSMTKKMHQNASDPTEELTTLPRLPRSKGMGIPSPHTYPSISTSTESRPDPPSRLHTSTGLKLG